MNSLTLVFFHLLLASAIRLNNADGCPGCESPVKNPNSDDIRKLMSSTLSQTNAGYTVTNVKNCKSQVVAGIKYDCEVDIKSPAGVPSTCRLVVVQRPWEKDNKVQIISETCSSVSRTKREVCAGCPVKKDANSSEMKKKLTGILSQTNSGLSLVRGTECTSQIVAGIKYTCTLEVESPKTNGVQTCTLEFVEQPWLSPDPSIIKDTCSQLVRNKREVCAGCPVDQDANGPAMKKKLTGILSQTNSGLSLVKGEKCTSQVVAGIKYVCTLQVESPKTNGVQTCKLSFLEQPWISPDPQILEDTCSKLVRNKREVCAGCPIDQNPKDPEIEKKITDTLSHTNSGLGLVSIDKCTSQVVAGALYKCTIRVNSPNFNGVETCELEILEQPWISKDPQVVKDTCSQLGRARRELVGGLKDVDPKEKVLVQELATFAVKTLDDIDADSSKRVVTEVIKAQKQLVNGIMYYLTLRVRTTSCDENEEVNEACLSEDTAPQKMCDIQVYRSFADKSPLNAKVVKSECEPVSDLKKVGGFEPVQTNGDEVQKVAQFAAKRISEMVNSIYVKRIISIENAATQVVSGVNYALTLVLGDTDCMKNKMKENSVCKFLPHTKNNLVCAVEVYERPWDNVMKVTSTKCRDVPNVSVERTKRSLFGGYTPVESNGVDIQKATDFAEEKINGMVNCADVKKVVAVEEAQTQVVAGVNYALVLRLRDTDCMKNKLQDISTCQYVDHPEMDLLCDVVIFQNLDKEMSMTAASCKDVPSNPTPSPRNKRSLMGGAMDVEVNNTEIVSLFPLISREVTSKINSPTLMRVTYPLSATKQVVSGYKYVLQVLLSSTECPASVNTDPDTCHVPLYPVEHLCNVTIWSQPWLKLTKVTALTCEEVQSFY